MALTSLERIRSKVADKVQLRRERFTANGEADHVKLQFDNIHETPAIEVWADSVQQVEGVDYTVDHEHGIVVFGTAPTANTKLVFQYYASVWTDEELEDYLDQNNSNINVAAAMVLYAWAADVAKIAKRETLAGGGGVGAVTRDTSVAARELRNTAKALMDWEIEYGESIGTNVPADGITQVPWTESAHWDIEHQRFVREN